MYCALVEPFPSPSYSLVEYSTDRLEQLESLVVSIIEEANKTTAQKVVGLKQCKFCDGLAHCDEVAHTIQEEALSVIQPDEEEYCNEVDINWSLEVALLAEKWAKAVKERARDYISDGNEVDGWKLRSSGNVKSISDANLCAERITDTNQLGWAEILSASSISWTKLLKVWMKKRNESGATLKRSDAVAELELILKDVLTEKPKAQSLVKSK